jgi:hypothetical protein
MGIHKAWEDKLPVSKVDKAHLERCMLSKDVLESRLVDVLYDPVNVTR